MSQACYGNRTRRLYVEDPVCVLASMNSFSTWQGTHIVHISAQLALQVYDMKLNTIEALNERACARARVSTIEDSLQLNSRSQKPQQMNWDCFADSIIKLLNESVWMNASYI